VPGSALARIYEPSRRDSARLFHSRGPIELKDLSPTVRCLNNGVTRLWPSADLRDRECTFLVCRSERYDGHRPFSGLKVLLRICSSTRLLRGSQSSSLRKGVMGHDFLAQKIRRAAILWRSSRGRREHLRSQKEENCNSAND